MPDTQRMRITSKNDGVRKTTTKSARPAVKYLLTFRILIPALYIAGLLQYGLLAIGNISSGRLTLWTLDSNSLESSGPMRYIKDVAILLIGAAWPLLIHHLGLPRTLMRWVTSYAIWLISVLAFGCIGYLFGFSPVDLFLPAGLRWLLLLHFSFGIFLLASTLVKDKRRHAIIFSVLMICLIGDFATVMLQLGAARDVFSIAYGQARLTGLFSNAGVAGFFALSMCITGCTLDGVSIPKRLVMSGLCALLALSAGSRFATLSICLIVLMQINLLAGHLSRLPRMLFRIAMLPVGLLCSLSAYQMVVATVGRGDAITQQFEKGGRAATFLETTTMLSKADTIELLFGRGLGVGTNTAIGKCISLGIEPETYRFNLLADSCLLTTVFQMGVIGATLFFLGVLRFLYFARPRHAKSERLRYCTILLIALVTAALGNPFEQYYLMLAFAIGLGNSYWVDKEKGRP